METENRQSHLVARWEQLYFRERQAKTERSSDKADVLRSQMAFTELARASNM